MSTLALTSTTNTMEVIFHSDESYTDKGFSAEYSAYDPANREFKVTLATTFAQHLVRWLKCVDVTVALIACHYRARHWE